MEGAVQNSEERGIGSHFRGCDRWQWRVKDSRCLFVFNLSIFATSNFGKMTLISLPVFFSDD